jgi:hypothetical protein
VLCLSPPFITKKEREKRREKGKIKKIFRGRLEFFLFSLVKNDSLSPVYLGARFIDAD